MKLYFALLILAGGLAGCGLFEEESTNMRKDRGDSQVPVYSTPSPELIGESDQEPDGPEDETPTLGDRTNFLICEDENGSCSIPSQILDNTDHEKLVVYEVSYEYSCPGDYYTALRTDLTEVELPFASEAGTKFVLGSKFLEFIDKNPTWTGHDRLSSKCFLALELQSVNDFELGSSELSPY